jgi:putative ABC transport system permease protein
VVVLLVGALVITTTMISSVTERTQEIGILRAVGFRQTHIARIVLLEAIALSVLGGLLGWVAGAGAARLFGHLLARLSSPVAVDFHLVPAALLVALLLGVVSGLYPAVKAARLDPAVSLRQL